MCAFMYIMRWSNFCVIFKFEPRLRLAVAEHIVAVCRAHATWSLSEQSMIMLTLRAATRLHAMRTLNV
jgi:hypothetical protein